MKELNVQCGSIMQFLYWMYFRVDEVREKGL